MMYGGVRMQAVLEYFFCYDRKAQTTIAEHSHSYYELAYYCDGNGTTGIQGEKLTYHAGQYAIYEPGCGHDEYHNGTVKVCCLGFHLGADPEFIVENGVYTDGGRQIWDKVKTIQGELERREAYYHLAASLILSEILLLHQRRLHQRGGNFNPMHYVCQYIEENAAQEISLPSLAAMTGYSCDRFRHLFREITGVPPKKYIQMKRMEQAKKMLLNSQRSVSEIAGLCGFTNESQLSAAFKKQMGISPSKFRKGGGDMGGMKEVWN